MLRKYAVLFPSVNQGAVYEIVFTLACGADLARFFGTIDEVDAIVRSLEGSAPLRTLSPTSTMRMAPTPRRLVDIFGPWPEALKASWLDLTDYIDSLSGQPSIESHSKALIATDIFLAIWGEVCHEHHRMYGHLYRSFAQVRSDHRDCLDHALATRGVGPDEREETISTLSAICARLVPPFSPPGRDELRREAVWQEFVRCLSGEARTSLLKTPDACTK
ncbi:MAG: hypothetical protein FJ276_37210 [Planctomycetes bacterium]|nr:hypothetical protein [Planctomycetota bacterium]